MTDQRPPTYTGEPTNQTPPDFNLSTPEQTSKRVFVTLTLATDLNPSVVLAGITGRMGGQACDLIVGTSVHAFDLADDDQDEPAVQLVIDAQGGGIAGAYVDRQERAAEHAGNIGGVYVELPIVDDFRAKDGGR